MKINTILSGAALALLASTAVQANTGASRAIDARKTLVAPGVIELSGGNGQFFKGNYDEATAGISQEAFSFDDTTGASHQPHSLPAGSFYDQVSGSNHPYDADYRIASAASTAHVPEPETLVMSLAGLGLLAAMARRRKIS